MIVLKNVGKTYRHRGGETHALRHIDLHVPQETVFGIVGRSGAGKSTLLRCMNGLEMPDEGEVLIDGQDLRHLSPAQLRLARRKTGMIFQHFNLIGNSTVYDNAALPLKLAGANKKTIAETIDPLLRLVGLQGKHKHYPAQLSGGEKQRVAIARALANKPSLLLCDEATSALDPETTNDILELLKTVKREYRLSIVLITHEMSVIRAVADHVAVMENGRIVEQNDVLSLFTQPQTEVGKKLVRSTLLLPLPTDLANRLQAQPPADGVAVVRLIFRRDAVDNLALTELVRQFNLRVSVLQGNVQTVRHQSVGMLLIEVEDEWPQSHALRDYLRDKQIESEVLGYVARDA